MDQRATLLLCLGLLLAPAVGQAQTASQPATPPTLPCDTLLGRVTNLFDEPLTGATVMLAGTTNASSTNSEGRFILASRSAIQRGAMLQVSAAGYSSVELPLINCNALDVSLELLPGTRLRSDGRIKKTSKTGKVH
ncbi:carboxypeptidase-like regulatory domain-containing protein [Solirubrum puertoriconensis]|uniref:Carboxypeptidase-like regulatory domain-containing protein n=1 Tax=Solirubrum puertoriconensis TaxID=1751427 RepID=A0A9X0L6M4_SOLP1|nr:carboxypeptidase-like regulatory domain-containing protein [Solirubrum puertoriconensis]KUG09948.1 hypothetical protein ASU33_20590 [Solirubrum puertoriconensis]